MNWTEIYKDVVLPTLDWTPPEKRQDTGIIGDMCELEKWHTQNCPPFEDVYIEMEPLTDEEINR